MRSKALFFSILLVLGLMLSPPAWAQLPTITLSDLGVGVRALGMGEAFVGLSDDEQAIFYNPAGLAYLPRITMSAFYESHFAGSDYFNASAAMRHLGLGLGLFNFGTLEQRDANDQVTGSLGYLSFSFIGAAALSLNELPLRELRGLGALALGMRAKYLGISTLTPGGGAGFGIDPAFMVNLEGIRILGLSLEALRTGLALENLLSTGTFYEGGRQEPWTAKLRLGTALLLKDLAVGLDLAVPFELHLGSELRFRPLRELGELAIRAGGMLRGGVFSLTMGFGIQVLEFRLDYAFMSHPQLPFSHRLALSWRL